MTLYPAPPNGLGARVICCRSEGPSWLSAATSPPGSATWRVTTCGAVLAEEGCPPGDASCASASSDFTTATCNNTMHSEQVCTQEGSVQGSFLSQSSPRLWTDPVLLALICITPTLCSYQNTACLSRSHPATEITLNKNRVEQYCPQGALGNVGRHFLVVTIGGRQGETSR